MGAVSRSIRNLIRSPLRFVYEHFKVATTFLTGRR
jgi:hypothetical protein